MSATFQQAVEHAAWWTRYAIDRAPEDPDIPISVRRDLKSARPLLDLAERTLAEPTPKHRSLNEAAHKLAKGVH